MRQHELFPFIRNVANSKRQVEDVSKRGSDGGSSGFKHPGGDSIRARCSVGWEVGDKGKNLLLI